MGLHCYTWIMHLFKKIIRGDYDDDSTGVEVEGLSKSLAVVQCHDRRLNQNRERPQILRYFRPDDAFLRLFIIDGKSEKECKARGLSSIDGAYFVSCCNGLVLVSWWYGSVYTQYAVLNPLSRERITKIGTPNIRGSRSCGFFFHPWAKEYRVLAVAKRDKTNYEYHLYSFGAQKWRKIANPYFHCEPTVYWKSPNSSVNGNPAIANGALHWYIKGSIMVFDMINEKFAIIPLPFVEYLQQKVSFYGHLVAKEDCLCFCVVGGFREPYIDIWILEDYVNWCWARKYVVNLDWDVNEYPMTEDFAEADCFAEIRIISIHRDELVLFWRYRGVFSYHLDLHTIQKISMKKLEKPTYCSESRYDYYCGFAAYNTTTSDQGK